VRLARFELCFGEGLPVRDRFICDPQGAHSEYRTATPFGMF
jgi:hypothetical protein